VGAVAMVLHLRLRQQWRSWLALAALVALVGGFVMAAAATGRRTAAAFPGFAARHGYDAIVYSGHPLPGLAGIPQVALVTPIRAPFAFPGRCTSCRKPIDPGSFGIFEVAPGSLSRVVRLLSGRMPDQSKPDEVLASYTLAQDNGVRIGSVIQVLTPTPAQVELAQKVGRPTVNSAAVPWRSLRVVGLVVAENEFPAGNGARYDLFPAKAFAAAVNHRALVVPFYYVRLRHGAADLPAFESQLRPLGSLGADDLDIDAAAVQRAIKPQAVGWWVLAGLAALAGLAVIGQAAARQFTTARDDRQALSAVGFRVRQFVALGLARALIIGVAGAAGAVALAALLSPLTPVGEARLADAAPGRVTIDPLVAVIGALATAAVVVALSAWPAVRHARLLRGDPAPRPVPAQTALVRAVARIGASPSMVIGVRHALERGRGREPVPVGTALLGMALAVAALCATAVFGASLTRLISSPALYGVPFQAEFSNQGTGSGSAITGPVLTSLRKDPAIARITVASLTGIDVNGRQVRAVAAAAIRGPALISVVDGRLPRGDREIMLGAATMRNVGARTGGLVQVTVTDPQGAPHQARFRVVGRASFPPGFGTGGLGTGAAMTVSALTDVQCPPGVGRHACQRKVQQGAIYHVLARAAPGPAAAAALARHVSTYRQFSGSAQEPAELVNFGESVNFPLLFGGMLAVFGAATMVHLLVVSVSRRRAEAGLLKVLGFARYQVAAVVSWQATTVALVGIAAGVPLGIAAGRVFWRVFATNFGVVPLTAVEALPVAALAFAVLAAANVLAFFPALLAARSRPAQLLRAE
jgi:ABC-type lipoprotein release transport system permease subunit